MPKFPQELVDKIIAYTNLETAIKTNNEYNIGRFYNKHRHTILQSAKNGNLETIKWLYNKGMSFKEESVFLAAENGHTKIVQFLLSKMNKTPEIAIDYAAKSGDLEMVKWLHNHCEIDSFTIVNAIKHNHLDLVKWLCETCENSKYYFTSIHKVAVEIGNMDIVKYIYEMSEFRYMEQDILDLAVRSGNLEVVKYLHSEGYEFGKFTFLEAVKSGNLEVFEWLCMMNCKNDHSLNIEYGLKGGNLDIIKYLYEKDQPLSPIRSYYATTSGNLKLVEWLFEQNFEFDGINGALCNGSLEIVKLFLEKGYVLSEDAMSTAAVSGNLELLQFLHKMGLGYDKDTMWQAAEGGHMNVVWWLYDIGCDICDGDEFRVKNKERYWEFIDWVDTFDS